MMMESDNGDDDGDENLHLQCFCNKGNRIGKTSLQEDTAMRLLQAHNPNKCGCLLCVCGPCTQPLVLSLTSLDFISIDVDRYTIQYHPVVYLYSTG